MKATLFIGIFLIFIISSICWFVFKSTSDEMGENEDAKIQKSTTELVKKDDQPLDQNAEKKAEAVKTEQPKQETELSSPKDSNARIIPSESKIEKPFESQKNSNVNTNSPSTAEPKIVTSHASNVENNTKKEDRISKEIYFVNDKNQILFSGKKIPIREGVFEVSSDVKVNLKKFVTKDWRFEIDSTEYFFDIQKNKFVDEKRGTFDWNAISDSQPVVLTNFCKIEISLKYKEGLKPLPNGTKCRLSTYYTFAVEGVIQDGKAIFKTEEAYTTGVEFFYAEKYFSIFSQQIKLIRGETTTFEIELSQGAEQGIRLLDGENKPLSDYYVIFANGSDLSFNLTQYQKYYIANGKLHINEATCKTDKDGFGKALFLANGQYVCHVFGQKHSGTSMKVVVDDSRNIIELVLKDDLQRSLKINVMENGQPYLAEIKVSYYDLNEYSAMNHKLIVKVMDGQIELKNLKATKYQFQVNENEFEREIAEINLIDSKSLEQTFHLKKSTNFVHGYVKDKKGNPIEKVSISLSHNYVSIEGKTDKTGYFKIGGLENGRGYSIFISSDYPKPNLPKLVYPSPDEFNITLADKMYIKGIVLGVDGKPVDKYVMQINCYKDKNLKDFSLGTWGNVNQGKFSAQVYSYGYFEITVRLANAAFIYKVIPILTEEDNQPITLQAEEGFPITGTIQDCDNKLMENASITRHDYRGPFVQKIYDEILKSDKNGYFKLDHCLVGEKYFVVKVGFVPIPITVKEEDKNTPLKLSFVKAYKLKGSLKSSDKTPHKLIQVVGNLKGNSKYEIVSETDTDGNFLINSVPPGEWYFYFNIKTAKGKRKPGQLIAITDKDEEINIEYDLPKE